MRLKSLSIKNFKGIDEQGITIDFAPITLLFGPNNAGKSTVIQALHLAREVFCEQKPDLNRLEKYGKAFNLGSFRDYVHKHDLNRTVSIKLEYDGIIGIASSFDISSLGTLTFNNEQNFLDIDTLIEKIESFSFTINISWDFSLKTAVMQSFTIEVNETKLTTLSLDHRNSKILITNDGFSLLPFFNNDEIDAINATIVAFQADNNSENEDDVIDVTVVDETKEDQPVDTLDLNIVSEVIEPYFLGFLMRFFDLNSILTIGQTNFSPATIECSVLSYYHLWNDRHKFSIQSESDELSVFVAELKEELELVSNDFFNRFLCKTGQKIGKELEKLLYIGPMREILPRGIQTPQRITRSRWADGLAAWDILLDSSKKERDSLNAKCATLGLHSVIQLREKIDIAEFKNNLTLLQVPFLQLGDKINDVVALNKDILPQFNEIKEDFESKIKKLDYELVMNKLISELTSDEEFQSAIFNFIDFIINYDEETIKIQSKIKEFLIECNVIEQLEQLLMSFIPISEKQILFKDVRTGVTTEPHDMGLGISQIIPFIIAMEFSPKSAFIAIEQPELHIHPKLQVNLGDLIIESALKSDTKPLFLIETHSEHLMLRLLRRIRESSEGEQPEELSPITKKDVAVNYIYPTPEGKTLFKKLPITDDGDFATRWPDGFFDERGKELF